MILAAQEPNYDTAAAERRAERIRLRLDSIADNITTVLPMIREAIEKNDHAALGYRSVGEYVADRFGSALSRLPVDLRRPVHNELHAAGMSTRAIASVTGASKNTVTGDLRHVSQIGTRAVDRETGEILDDPTPATVVPKVVDTPATATTGIDGKTYTRKSSAPKTPPRRAITDQFFDAAYDMGKAVEKVARLTEDDRFPQNAEKVAAKHRNDLLRSRDLLQQVIDRLA